MIVLNLILTLFLSLTNAATLQPKPTKVAECDAKIYKDKCIDYLNLQQGYTFLKSYTIDGKAGAKKTVEFSYIFSKNTNYLITLANNNPQTKGIAVTLYDSNKKRLASSLATNGKFYPAVSYKCNATGIYRLIFTFENANDYCAGAVLGFKR